ncbi:hypothetical protein OS493_000545 [Desmophyllum pertusum]|uniref:Uncharacterized protein n=1 Tax=Desmophyllum pertusum TaxID=174260 RepID=A0A9X0AAZ8_9CNID|nr:hypothetical protein OS493_000545 [Desmophyllum pertusum]
MIGKKGGVSQQIEEKIGRPVIILHCVAHRKHGCCGWWWRKSNSWRHHRGPCSSQITQQGKPHAKELVSQIFHNPDAVNLLWNALFSQVSNETSTHNTVDAGAIKAHETAPDIETPAAKRPKGEMTTLTRWL